MNTYKWPKYVDFVKQNRTKEQAKQIHSQRIEDSRFIYEKYSGTFNFRPCPVCGISTSRQIDKFDANYGIHVCDVCNSKFVNPCPTLDALDDYYNNCECNEIFGELLRSRVGKGGIILGERGRDVLGVIDDLLLKSDHIKVLEIGCNSGAFLATLLDSVIEKGLQEKIEFRGIDIDKNAILNPVSNDIELYHSSVEEFCQSNHSEYDLVIHFELLEHLQDPFSFMNSIQQLLKTDGITYFHTPNSDGMDNTALGYNDFRPLAHGLFPPMHLQAFTPKNILHFLIRSNLKVRDITTPGNFDVDIVKQFLPKDAISPFVHIHSLERETLAILQSWLKVLGASSHMAVTAAK